MNCITASLSQQTFIRSDSRCYPGSAGKRSHMEAVAGNSLSKGTAIKKLSKGQLVYLRDSKEGWITGTVVDAFENKTTVLTGDGRTLSAHADDVNLRPEGYNFLDCSKLTEVTPINEATVLECLHQRFLKNIYYTSAGTTIVAVNPFRELPELYNINRIEEYHQHNEALSPHIYLIAENAYTSMVRGLGKINQSIVVSGESGAGKTVSAKHLLRYLTIVSSPEQNVSLKSAPGSAIERRVLDSNPILEAFGNAATPRNENSSRFGKFIQLQFHRNGHILGGAIQTYLLEKTRVVHQGTGENNFHIFYRLLSLQELSAVPLWLEGIKGDVERSKLKCAMPYQAEAVPMLQITDAMTDIGLEPATQVSIFQVLLAILHLTELKFMSSRDEEASSIADDEGFSNTDIVSNWARDESSRLLGISTLSLHHALLNRNIVSGTRNRSVYVKPVGVEEAHSRRDCLAMLLYARLFEWLVNFINHQIKATEFDRSISLLDIYGFEAFDVNGLEQLCINYANERLQQHYVTYFLRDLQTEYELERIPWSCVTYRDNKACVESLDGPAGVFGVFNEEVHLSRKSLDSGVCGRIVAACGAHGVVRKSQAGTYDTGFYVRHYAGEVLYTVMGAVTKNKDNIPPELVSLLGTSENSFVLNLFTDEEFSQTEQPLTLAKVKKKKTVLTKFKSSLDGLISSLQQSDTHYIRCIKPNSSNQADYFDRPYVLQQLQACGTLETVEICRMGYPARMVYQDFNHRYGMFTRLKRLCSCLGLHQATSSYSSQAKRKCSEEDIKENLETFYQKIQSHLSCHDGHLHRNEHKRLRKRSGTFNQEHKMCALILMVAFSHKELQDCHLQFGLHKIFLTQTQLEHLEHARAEVISALVTKLQATWCMVKQRRWFCLLRAAAVTLQTSWRAHVARRDFHHMRSAVVQIQRAWKAYRTRHAVNKLLRSSKIIRRFLTTWIRRWRFHTSLQKLRQSREEIQKEHQDKLDALSKSESLTELCSSYLDPQESLHTNMEFSESPGHSDNGCIENDNDSSGHWSDDSGVMIKEDNHIFPVDPSFEAPPMKKQKVAFRSDLQIGNGVITCRRLTKPGYRFHVRKSVLKYGHVVHHSELVHGLPDALPDRPANEASSHVGVRTSGI